jgi:hypothetical protein
MNSVQARQRVENILKKQQAEKILKKEVLAQEGREAMTEYLAEARATRAKTERLKALRLDRNAHAIELQSITAL